MVDHKLTWEEHTRYVIQTLIKARVILAKLRHHAPQSILINVYYSIVYLHLYYDVTSWGTTAAKYTDRIQTEQNSIVKIITKLPFLKTKISPLYDKLNLLRLDDIYNLEVLKFICLCTVLKRKFCQIVFRIILLYPRKYMSILPGLLVMITGQ